MIEGNSTIPRSASAATSKPAESGRVTNSLQPTCCLGFLVHDALLARLFCGELLGYPERRTSPEWIALDFHSHQIVAHLPHGEIGASQQRNAVDGHGVLVRHFEIGLPVAAGETMAEHLKAQGVNPTSATKANC